jgi:hypothetical protein
MNSSVLSQVSLFTSENFKELREFLKSISFSRAIRIGIAVTLHYWACNSGILKLGWRLASVPFGVHPAISVVVSNIKK